SIGAQLRENFDTSGNGIGAGIAGAVIGGLGRKRFGHDSTLKTVGGALIGALAANAIENKYRGFEQEGRSGAASQKEKAWEQKWDKGSRTGRDKNTGSY
ncbi:hypothetical protein LTR28_005436, partial [Elasticomyces elasticus]